MKIRLTAKITRRPKKRRKSKKERKSVKNSLEGKSKFEEQKKRGKKARRSPKLKEQNNAKPTARPDRRNDSAPGTAPAVNPSLTNSRPTPPKSTAASLSWARRIAPQNRLPTCLCRRRSAPTLLLSRVSPGSLYFLYPDRQFEDISLRGLQVLRNCSADRR